MNEFFFSMYRDVPGWIITLETIVFFFGILSVYFAKQQNIRVFPTGLIATTISVFLLYRAGYMADMTINLYYSLMSIYGWYCWAKPSENGKTLTVSRTSPNEKIIGVALFVLTIIVTFTIYKIFDVDLLIENYVDLFTSGLFFTAMWYMARKKLENWMLWIVGNLITIPLYAYKGLGILSLQYVIFTVLALLGYLAWKKELEQK
ncbi:MAG: nicotinamide riboside transporter PnuC [Flavobacterium sp.]